jgi:hypothetical protein
MALTTMNQVTTIDSTTSPPRNVFPWHGVVWVATTVCIVAWAAGTVPTSGGLVLLAPTAVLIAGSAIRPNDYALSRRRLPPWLVASFVITIVLAIVAVLAASDPLLTVARALPAFPSAVIAYLHLRTPSPPKATPAAAQD